MLPIDWAMCEVLRYSVLLRAYPHVYPHAIHIFCGHVGEEAISYAHPRVSLAAFNSCDLGRLDYIWCLCTLPLLKYCNAPRCLLAT
jgi:hypothetical protein